MENEYFYISFTVLKQVPFGKSVYLCGSLPNTGCWNTKSAKKLKWTPNHKWHIKVDYKGLRNKINFEYKYFVSDTKMTSDSVVEWEQGINRNIKCRIDNMFFTEVEVIFVDLEIG